MISGLVVIWIAALLFGAVILQALWNMTMPEALGTKPIRYWIAFRLLLIGAIMTGGGFIQFKF